MEASRTGFFQNILFFTAPAILRTSSGTACYIAGIEHNILRLSQ
jgi:hypothetical protein